MLDLNGVNTLISADVRVESIRKLENKIGKTNSIDTDSTFSELKDEYNIRDSSFNDLSIIPYMDFLEE